MAVDRVPEVATAERADMTPSGWARRLAADRAAVVREALIRSPLLAIFLPRPA